MGFHSFSKPYLRILFVLSLFFLSLVALNTVSNPPLITNVWAAGANPLPPVVGPTKEPVEPPRPPTEPDLSCWDVTAWATKTETSTVSCVDAYLLALTPATQGCVDQLTPCPAPGQPDNGAVCVANGQKIVVELISCDKDVGFFNTTYTGKVTVYCANLCKKQ